MAGVQKAPGTDSGRMGTGSASRRRNQSAREFQVRQMCQKCGGAAAKCGRSEKSEEAENFQRRLGKKGFRSEGDFSFEGRRVGEKSIYRREIKGEFQI